MCDGRSDEPMWTLKSRQSGRPILTTSGHSYLFAEQADALEFARLHPETVDLDVIPIPQPE
jgi:hypothetical protein